MVVAWSNCSRTGLERRPNRSRTAVATYFFLFRRKLRWSRFSIAHKPLRLRAEEAQIGGWTEGLTDGRWNVAEAGNRRATLRCLLISSERNDYGVRRNNVRRPYHALHILTHAAHIQTHISGGIRGGGAGKSGRWFHVSAPNCHSPAGTRGGTVPSRGAPSFVHRLSSILLTAAEFPLRCTIACLSKWIHSHNARTNQPPSKHSEQVQPTHDLVVSLWQFSAVNCAGGNAAGASVKHSKITRKRHVRRCRWKRLEGNRKQSTTAGLMRIQMWRSDDIAAN